MSVCEDRHPHPTTLTSPSPCVSISLHSLHRSCPSDPLCPLKTFLLSDQHLQSDTSPGCSPPAYL